MSLDVIGSTIGVSFNRYHIAEGAENLVRPLHQLNLPIMKKKQRDIVEKRIGALHAVEESRRIDSDLYD